MAMMCPMRLTKTVYSHEHRPSSEDFAYPVIPFAVWQQAIMHCLMHHHRETILPSTNPNHSANVERGMPIGLAQNYGGGDRDYNDLVVDTDAA